MIIELTSSSPAFNKGEKMLYTVLLLALATFVASEKYSYENYKVFRVTPSNIEQLEVLRQIQNEDINEFMFWKGPSTVHRDADVMVGPHQINDFIELMNATDTKYEIYIKNVQKLIDEEKNMVRSQEYGWTSYYRLKDIYSWMDSLQQKYPDIVEVFTAGKTYEGRQIRGAKISFGGTKPGVFIDGGIHAREWIATATVTYIMNQLLESTDPDVATLARSYDWYFIPNLNPDGYEYTHTSNRLWRKTLSKSNLLCKGVDPNRNWDFKWDAPGGASKRPCAEDYSGKFPFSEVETNSTAQYLLSIRDKLFTYISFHSYSQLLLIPYGYTSQHLENFDDVYRMSVKAVGALSKRYGTKYVTGNTAETIYVATGSSMDWAKGVLKVPISVTYELRDTGRHGFLLPPEQIIPTGEEILDSFVAFFDEATKLGYPKES